MVLSFLVDKQIITRVDKEKVVRDSMNYLYANFEFSPDWTGQKTAVFKSKSGAFNVLLDDDGKCLVPWEVLQDEVIEISVFCGALITANVVKIITLASGYTIGEEGREPTPDVYTQIMEKLSEIEAEIDPEAIQALIDAYLADKDFVTEDDVETIVAAYVDAHKSEWQGSEVEVTQTLSSGTKIAEISVDGTTTNLYAPAGGGGATALDALTDVDLTTPQSGDVLVYDGQKWGNSDVVTDNVDISTGLTRIYDVNHIENPFPPVNPYINLVDGVLTMNAPASGNISPSYHIYDSDLADSNGICTIRLHVTSVDGTWKVQFRFTNTSGGTVNSKRLEISETGTYDVDLRLDELTIYNNYDGNGINVMLVNVSNSVSIVVDEFSTYVGESTNLAGNTLTENLIDSDTRISALENKNNVILTSPSGDKFLVQLDSNNQIQLIPVIPNDVVYIGNSLLVGFTTHGMASYDTTDDYFALVNDYIEDKGVTLTTHKVPAAMYERAENDTQLNTFLSTLLLPALSNSTKLVIIQAGDNTTTQASRDFFKTSCGTLIEFIHTNAPNARIAWVGTWYGNSINETIDSICKQYGIARIPLFDLSLVDGNMNHIGAKYIDANGDEQTITEIGVATHPSPQGMRAIADRIISALFE